MLIEDRNNMRFYDNKRARFEGDKDAASSPDKNKRNNVNTNYGGAPVNNPTASTNAWTKQSPTKADNASIADFKAEVLEQLDKNNKQLREEIQEVNVTINKRITTIDKKLESHITSVQDNLQDIKVQNTETKLSVESNVSRLENIFWKMWSKFEDAPEQPIDMDFQNCKSDLKRRNDQILDESQDLDESLDTNEVTYLATQNPDTRHDNTSVKKPHK
jgi:hypothetical protein